MIAAKVGGGGEAGAQSPNGANSDGVGMEEEINIGMAFLEKRKRRKMKVSYL